MERTSYSQLIAAVGGTAVGLSQPDGQFIGVATDSRVLRAGEVFWALRGATHDGHDFIAQALERGAGACVVARQPSGRIKGPLIIVPETLAALSAFAAWYRQERETMVIGVTGSVGKTTTREMIHAVLTAGYQGVRSQKNYNNEIGLPLSLLEIENHHDFAVLELGARQPGDIAALADVAQPEVGVITGISPTHLETFGSIERILEAKGELFDALPAKGFAVLPGDDERIWQLAQRAVCPVILVGEGPHNTIRALQVESHPRELRFRVNGERYRVPVAGRHHLNAALIAIAIGLEVGLDPAAIGTGLQRFVGAPGRCRVEQIGPWTVIDDTYNASPASMQAACRLLQDWRDAPHKLLVAGGMLELGEEAATYHAELGRQAAAAEVDRLLVHGPHADAVIAGAVAAGLDPHCLAVSADLNSLLAVLDCWLSPNDVILVKGSRGMRMERVVDWLRQRAAENGAEPAADWKAVA